MTEAGKPLPKLFIVDDDAHLLSRLSATLRRHYEIEVFDSPLVLLARLEHGRPGGVLSDVVMPHMNGFELVRAIRRRFPGLPVALWTAYRRQGDVDKSQQAGASAFFRKPVTMVELRVRIERLLGLKPAPAFFVED